MDPGLECSLLVTKLLLGSAYGMGDHVKDWNRKSLHQVSMLLVVD